MSKCQLLPFLKARHRHHTHYTHGPWYGPPYRMGWDILNLSPLAHSFVHFPYGRVGTQNKSARSVARWFPRRCQPLVEALLQYPNPGQRTWHMIARLNWLLSKIG